MLRKEISLGNFESFKASQLFYNLFNKKVSSFKTWTWPGHLKFLPLSITVKSGEDWKCPDIEKFPTFFVVVVITTHHIFLEKY